MMKCFYSFLFVFVQLAMIAHVTNANALDLNQEIGGLSDTCKKRSDTVEVYFTGISFPGNMMKSVARIQFSTTPFAITVYSDFGTNIEYHFDLDSMLYQ